MKLRQERREIEVLSECGAFQETVLYDVDILDASSREGKAEVEGPRTIRGTKGGRAALFIDGAFVIAGRRYRPLEN